VACRGLMISETDSARKLPTLSKPAPTVWPNTSAGQPKAPYKPRKETYIQSLAKKDNETLLVSLSDKVHNARSILRDLRKHEVGAAVWTRFSSTKEDTLWYYEEFAKKFKVLMPKHQLADELGEIVDVLKSG
jgi:hypothetical protein